MTRLAPTLLVVALLAATAVAFVVAEREKLQPSPILRPDVDEVFSPVCECPQRLARIAFTLRSGARTTVEIVDGDGERVRVLIAERRYARGERVDLVWDGDDERGRRAPDGEYQPRLELGRRTIVMPNRITLDSRPPRVEVTPPRRTVISPDGDGRFDGATIRYTLDEPAQPILYVGRRRHEQKRSRDLTGEFRWYGRLGARRLPAGRYRLAVAAEDDAGNVSERTPSIPVRIRFVELARSTIRARAGTRFGVRVRTDDARIRWRLGRRSGSALPGLLVLRAPQRPGRYTLVVTANRHSDRARLIVTRRR